MNTTELVFIDLSSIAYPIWHMSQAEPDPNATSRKVIERVRALASSHAHVAVCCDSGRSFRRDIAPSYKANRPESDATLQHQIALVREALEADGFPIWKCEGCEADDIIATAVSQTLATPELSAVIVSADKDLLQLVGERVRALSVRDGSTVDAAAVVTKFGVEPHRMRDYLTLVGDAADNIKGAKGIGPKKAVEILTRFGSVDELYRRLDETNGDSRALGLQPSVVASLREFRADLPTTRQLVTLKTDCEIPFAEIAAERVPKDVARVTFDVEDDMETASHDATAIPTGTAPALSADVAASVPNAGGSDTSSTALAVRETDTILPAPADWERGLDPRSMKDARVLAKDMFDSRMFSAYGTPQAILSTVMVGRELGLPAMASLRCIHNIEGKHSLSAALMVALVLKSGLAEFFEPVEFDAQHATFETKRKSGRKPITLTHTIEDAQRAWSKSEDAWHKSGWGRNPADMLVARAEARLARLVYPDLLAGLYTPEELDEIRQALAA